MIMSDKFMLLKFIGHKNRGPYSCSKNKYAEKARGTNPKRVFNHRNPPSIIFLSFEMVCVQVIASLLKRTKAARERHAIVASLVATDPGDSSNTRYQTQQFALTNSSDANGEWLQTISFTEIQTGKATPFSIATPSTFLL